MQGYASEMDNPSLVHLIPSALQNKKEILFGNLPEIYEFHNRHVGTGGCPAPSGAPVIAAPLMWVLGHTHTHRGRKSHPHSASVCVL